MIQDCSAENLKIISGLRTLIILFWLTIVVAMAGSVAYHDITGRGLRTSMYFRLFGIGLYPFFYGSCAYAIYSFVVMLICRNRYIAICNDETLLIGNRTYPLESLRAVEKRRNPLRVSEILIYFSDRSPVGIRQYVLRRPADEIVGDLRRAIPSELME